MAELYRKNEENKAKDKINELCLNLPDYVRAFLSDIKTNTLPKTRLAYVKDLKTFFEYYCEVQEVQVVPKDITCKDLEKLDLDFFNSYTDYLEFYRKDGKEYSNGKAAIKRKLSSLRKLYDYLFRGGHISVNNITKVAMPKLEQKQIIYMNQEEKSDFVNKVETGYNTESYMANAYHDRLGIRDYTIITLLLSTGMRVSELVGLDITDINNKECFANIIRKGYKEAKVYYSDDMQIIMERYLSYRKNIQTKETSENALFISYRGNRISTRSVEYLVKKYAISAVPGKKISPHKLRATFGTALYEQTGDIYLTAEALGHNDVNTTKKHYANLSEERMKDARNKVSITQ